MPVGRLDGGFLGEVYLKPIKIAGRFIILAMVLPAVGCTWVPLTTEGQKVRVVDAANVADCQKLGTTTSKTASRVVIFARTDRKVHEELESLARNEAAEMGGRRDLGHRCSERGTAIVRGVSLRDAARLFGAADITASYRTFRAPACDAWPRAAGEACRSRPGQAPERALRRPGSWRPLPGRQRSAALGLPTRLPRTRAAHRAAPPARFRP